MTEQTEQPDQTVRNVVVIGAGLAAASAVEELREQGYDGDITVFGTEEHLPYERPPLSKAVLLGQKEADSAILHDEQWYADRSITLELGTTVTGLDLERREVVVGDRRASYDRLLIATGATPRHLPDLDDSGADVAYLRTIEDSLALRDRKRGHLLVVGGGWIGLEAAAAFREAGAEVTVVEAAPLPLGQVLGPEVAPVFADLHREHGVDLRLGTTVESVEAADGASRVRLSDGHELTADLVLVGIGAVPDDGLAAAAGLATDHGILVDATLRAGDPHVYAVGDVANHDHPVLGRRIRVEHWDTAIHQGRHAARNLLGADAPYERQPYFFTDQYDLGMEYVGSVGPDGYDDVVIRGDLAARDFRAFWISDGRVVAGMHVNDWDAIDDIRSRVGQAVTDDLR